LEGKEPNMMPVIRISEGTWEKLKAHAIPLEDTPDDVISRALDALEAAKPKSTAVLRTPRSGQREGEQAEPRPQRGTKLPQKAFRVPLLESLYELGGQAQTSQVRKIVERRMAPQLNKADYDLVSSGDPRWWNATCWERNDLVKEGLFRRDSERGVWELSEKGIKFVESSRKR
jgi:hypothetical protein